MIRKPSATNAVPKNYMGVWQRQLLETAITKDDTSLVLWMQTQRYHIDIRIPASRSNIRKVSALEEYTDKELLLLASQQGFAGITQVNADICQWHREIDFQPPYDARDIGKMIFTNNSTVIETGLDNEYLEIWQQVANSQAPCFFEFTTGKNRKGLARPAYLMRVGSWVAYARTRSVILPKYNSLLDAIISYKPQLGMLLDWLDMEISIGEIIDEKYWKIKYSTLPFKEQSIAAYGHIK